MRLVYTFQQTRSSPCVTHRHSLENQNALVFKRNTLLSFKIANRYKFTALLCLMKIKTFVALQLYNLENEMMTSRKNDLFDLFSVCIDRNDLLSKIENKGSVCIDRNDLISKTDDLVSKIENEGNMFSGSRLSPLIHCSSKCFSYSWAAPSRN